jgi:DNA polymerase-1
MGIVYRKKLKKLVKHLDRLSPIEINHAGPLQVRQLLYGAWKLEPHEVKMGKKRVRYSTGKAALELLLNDDLKEEQRDYVTNLLEYRKESKLYGTYIVGMPRYLRNGYIHANWNLTGTDSGRTSCNDPNLQQIPRKGDINKLFISRYGRDGVIMEVDVSQGELRLAAHSSKEPTLTRLFREDRVDIHTAIAAVMFNKAEHSITEEERFQAKTVNFLILYGGGIKILAQSIKKDDNTAAKLLHTWYKRFPRWKEYVNEQEDEIVANHCVRSVFGRYRRLFILERDTKEGMMTLRKGINAPIQGGLGDYNKLCGYNVWSKLNAKRGTYYHRAKMIMEIHDAWKLDLPKKLVSDVAQIVKEEFENVDTSEFGFKFRVPMKVEIKVGPNGKDMEPYEL